MLDIRKISKTFNPGTVNEKTAIRDLSLHLDRGDFVTIIGANGAGKSTLFNAIAGSFFTDAGSIWLDGQDITFQPEYKRAKVIGRLFQDPTITAIVNTLSLGSLIAILLILICLPGILISLDRLMVRKQR